MFSVSNERENKNFREGIVLQYFGRGDNIDAIHWVFDDGEGVALHHHPQEQFGYFISSVLEMTVGDETGLLRAGDASFVPVNVPNKAIARGETETLDLFTPYRIVE